VPRSIKQDCHHEWHAHPARDSSRRDEMNLSVGFSPRIAYENQCMSSPRSGRQHKAWGVSPRSSNKNVNEPAKRVIALNIRPNDSAVARFGVCRKKDFSVHLCAISVSPW
jgi:hypothetical protein